MANVGIEGDFQAHSKHLDTTTSPPPTVPDSPSPTHDKISNNSVSPGLVQKQEKFFPTSDTAQGGLAFGSSSENTLDRKNFVFQAGVSTEGTSTRSRSGRFKRVKRSKGLANSLAGALKLPGAAVSTVVNTLAEAIGMSGSSKTVPRGLKGKLQELELKHGGNTFALDNAKKVFAKGTQSGKAVKYKLEQLEEMHSETRRTIDRSKLLLEKASLSGITPTVLLEQLHEDYGKNALALKDATQKFEETALSAKDIEGKLLELEMKHGWNRLSLNGTGEALQEASASGIPMTTKLEQQCANNRLALEAAKEGIKEAAVSGTALTGELEQIMKQLEKQQDAIDTARASSKAVLHDVTQIETALNGKLKTHEKKHNDAERNLVASQNKVKELESKNVELQKTNNHLESSKNSAKLEKIKLINKQNSYKRANIAIGGIGLLTSAASAAGLYYEYDNSRKQGQIIANLQKQLAASGPPTGSAQQGLTA